MLIQQRPQDPKSPQRIPTRKWKLLYLLALILSLPELFIWKWSISKEKCYLSIGPAKSKNYVTEFQYGRGRGQHDRLAADRLESLIFQY